MTNDDDRLSVSDQTRDAFAPVLKALRDGAPRLAAVPGLLTARPGFRYEPKPTPALVVSLRPPVAEGERTRLEQELADALAVPVQVLEAHPDEQRARLEPAAFAPAGPSELEKLLLASDVPDFRPPLVGSYRPPEGQDAPHLAPVDEEMKLTICVSPEGGWSVLRDFFATPAKERCTVAMYQFSAKHILEALSGAVKGKSVKLLMTLHPHGEPVPKGGTKANDLSRAQVLERLTDQLGPRFQHALTSIGSGGVFASAYHIKVAVLDGKRMWLSSGNWQSSNQPPADPFKEPEKKLPGFPRSFNRDYHVVIEHEGLARTYERFIEYDFEIARGEPPPFSPPPDLFVPEEEELPPDFAPVRLFPPKTLHRRIKVQPILTPDNYAPQVLELVRGAKKKLYLQNQYINLNPDGDLPGFQKLVKALLAKLEKGVDVRVICRNLMKPEKVDMLVALGFDIDRLKLMPACHTKTIIVDSERVLLGSHNWSNEGTVSNRDASLIFDDAEIAQYYEEIFLYDWDRLKAVKPHQLVQPRVAGEDEPTPAGMVRKSWSEVFDD
jgi:hypothetical protein